MSQAAPPAPRAARRPHLSGRIPWLLLGAAVLAAATGCSRASDDSTEAGWRVWALEYGRTTRFRRRSLVRGADRTETSELSWMVWVVRGKGRVILVDTGFDDADLARGWKVERRRSTARALADLSLRPGQVTDVVLTHAHWDHIGDLEPWTRARFWVQRAELEWAARTVSEAWPARGGVRLPDVQAIQALRAAGRARLVDGDAEVAPGVLLHQGGKHTPASQWVEVRTGRTPGTIVLASDNAYLYENLERRVAIGSTVDARANRAEQARMLEAASRPELVIPGHDPEVLRRFGRPGDRVVEIR